MAAAKQNTSLVRNTASRVTLGRGKSTGRKTTARRTTAKRNPARQVPSRRKYRRNTARSGAMNLVTTVFGAVLGAFIINLFDFGVNRLAPSTSAGIRTGVKGAVGAGLLMFGNKLPFGRSYAPMVGGAFILAAALDGVATYLMPAVTNLISPAPAIVSSTQGVTSTGELGMIHRDSQGNVYEVINQPIGQYSDGYNNPPQQMATV
jgi:hypothetical protein